MTFIRFLLLALAVCRAQLDDQPRISTTNGHLSFEAGNYKNIEFKSSTGKVLVNGNDLDMLQGTVDGHTQ